MFKQLRSLEVSFGVFSIRASSLTSGMQRTSTSRGPYLLCKIGRQTPLCSFRLQIIQFGVVCDVLDISEILDAKFLLTVTVDLPASTSIQYKYIRKFNGQVTWQPAPNRQFTEPASGSFTLNDVWT